MRLRDFLLQSDVLSDTKNIHERRRIKELARVLYKLLGKKADGVFHPNHGDWDMIRKMIFVSRRLYCLDSRSVEHISYKSASFGLAHVLHRAFVHGESLRFLSFASNAIQIHSRKLKEKKQYDRPNKILEVIDVSMSGTNLPWTYEVILADDDYLLPRGVYGGLWQENLVRLRSVCRVPSRFLSTLFDDDSCNQTKNEIEALHPGVIAQEALKYENNPSFRRSFKTDLKRNMHQMLQYAALGLQLERSIPTCIVLDIQKKIYPYEQPYFDRFRLTPLALFRCFSPPKK